MTCHGGHGDDSKFSDMATYGRTKFSKLLDSTKFRYLKVLCRAAADAIHLGISSACSTGRGYPGLR
eukprot:SAG31_NODE_37238_length_306_cov_0.695652_1_plen_65_part_10